MPRKTKEQKAKEAKAKERVDKLLEGIEVKTTDKKKVTDRIAKLEKETGDSWLEEQVDGLSAENEELKSKLSTAMEEAKQAKEDYKKLFEQKGTGLVSPSGPVTKASAPSVDREKLSKLKIFMNEMDRNMRGKNPSRRSLPDVKISYVLKKLLDIFPEVKN